MKTLAKATAVAGLCMTFAAGSAFAGDKKSDDPVTGVVTFVEGVVMLPIKAVGELLK